MNLNKIKLKLWEQGRLDYLLHEAQLVIFNTLSSMDSGQEKEIMLLSSRRFGKSYFSIIYSFMKCLSKPKMRILVVAHNKLQAREIIDPNI